MKTIDARTMSDRAILRSFKRTMDRAYLRGASLRLEREVDYGNTATDEPIEPDIVIYLDRLDQQVGDPGSQETWIVYNGAHSLDFEQVD